jgi:hypothetical protein
MVVLVRSQSNDLRMGKYGADRTESYYYGDEYHNLAKAYL